MKKLLLPGAILVVLIVTFIFNASHTSKNGDCAPGSHDLAMADTQLQILYPNKDEKFTFGQNVCIRWQASSKSKTITLMVVRGHDSHFTNNGSMASTRGYGIYEGDNTGSYNWYINNDYLDYGPEKWYMRIEDENGVVDYSDTQFTIL